MTDTLARLFATIEARAGARSGARSHTAALLAKGAGKCAEKFGEEAVEAIVAAASGDRAGADARGGRRALPPAGDAEGRGRDAGARCWRSSPPRGPLRPRREGRPRLTSTRGALVIGGVSAARSRSGPRGEGNPVEPDTFEIKIEALSRLDDVWRRWSSSPAAAGWRGSATTTCRRRGRRTRICCGSRTTASPRAAAQYLAARMSGVAVLATRSRTASGRSISTSSTGCVAGGRERAHLAAYRAGGIVQRPRDAGLRSEGPQRHLRRSISAGSRTG